MLRTEGVALRFCEGSEGCSDGDAPRAALEVPAEAWYSGNEGVDALDMLAWPKGHCCAAFKRGLSRPASGERGLHSSIIAWVLFRKNQIRERSKVTAKEGHSINMQRCRSPDTTAIRM